MKQVLVMDGFTFKKVWMPTERAEDYEYQRFLERLEDLAEGVYDSYGYSLS